MAKNIKIADLKSVLLADVETAKSQILSESGDIISDRIIRVSKGKIVPGIREGKDSVWVGVTGNDEYLEAMREEKFGTRPFANTLNWLRTRVPFIRQLQIRLPWVK